MDPALINNSTTALPGQHTTAHFLFSMAFPNALKKEFMLFADIEEAVLSGQNTLGVLIHENRFTYAAKGLHKIMDLGTYWEQQTGVPIPLGGIAIKKSLAESKGNVIQRLIAESLLKARQQHTISEFVRAHAQSMKPEVMQQHIDLYVNDYTLSLGSDGKKAIRMLFEVYQRLQASEVTDALRYENNSPFNEWLLEPEA
jgi:1,4-dihydroxy-6-naphthoate synthase